MIKNEIVVNPLAYVQNSRTSLDDDHWGSVISEITLESTFPEECFDGIETFSHVEIVFYFDKISDQPKNLISRHPCDNQDWPKVGIFAQRNKDRPNQIGLSIAQVIKREGRILFVRGLDAVNGTPVIDIKPVMVEFLPRETVTQPEWSHELMKNYWNQ